MWARNARGPRPPARNPGNAQPWTGFNATTTVEDAQARLDLMRKRRAEAAQRVTDARTAERDTLACLATLSRHMSPWDAATLTFGAVEQPGEST